MNGAQTTGAIANAVATGETTEALVPMRVVAVQDDDSVGDIVRYNNSQNQATASDFRSRCIYGISYFFVSRPRV